MKKKDTVRIYCENHGKHYEFPVGTTIQKMSEKLCPTVKVEKTGKEIPVIAALVDYRLKELEFKAMIPHTIKFIGYDDPDGRRTYVRSISFVLQNVISEMYPNKQLIIDYALPSGHYCEIREMENLEDGRPNIYNISDKELEEIKARMKKIIEADLLFHKIKLATEDAVEIFEANHQIAKAKLTQSIGKYTTSVYYLDGKADTFYGPLVPSTGYLRVFDIVAFSDGFCLQYPAEGYTETVMPLKRQSRIATALKEHSDWCSIMGVNAVGTLNNAVLSGNVVELINFSEALHERKYTYIADQIYAKRSQIRIVFIAGPSSSGKTSTSKRLAIQCRILGLNPKVLELDNYFVNREFTPRDEKGDYDFEALEAMDLDLLNKQLNELLEGKTIEIPRFSFQEGKRYYNGDFMKLEEKDILIMEGIHALNPAMLYDVDKSKIFRVYASALTSLSLDENNNISTSDNRMLRRMIRDNRTRGISPEDTIIRWSSVRRGENKNIFPFQENADAVFNSAHIFELPVLKYYAEPLLRRIPPSSPAFTEATRLLKFLEYIVALSPEEIAAIPPTSILREFVGGQTL